MRAPELRSCLRSQQAEGQTGCCLWNNSQTSELPQILLEFWSANSLGSHFTLKVWLQAPPPPHGNFEGKKSPLYLSKPEGTPLFLPKYRCPVRGWIVGALATDTRACLVGAAANIRGLPWELVKVCELRWKGSDEGAEDFERAIVECNYLVTRDTMRVILRPTVCSVF